MMEERTLADYRPQHDDGCGANKCADCGKWDFRFRSTTSILNHFCDGIFRPQPCSCGLDNLLRRSPSGDETTTDQGAGLIGQVASPLVETEPHLNTGIPRIPNVWENAAVFADHNRQPDTEGTEPRPIKYGTLGVPLSRRREPTEADFADPRFDVIWELIKRVDVDFRNGLFSGATGDDVCAVLDELDQVGSVSVLAGEASGSARRSAASETPSVEAAKDRMITQAFVAGQMDAQLKHADELTKR